MRSISLVLLAVLAATQVAALHCTSGAGERADFLDDHPPTVAHGAVHEAQDHSAHHRHAAPPPAGASGEAPGLPVDGHDHEDASECTMLLACGGPAVPRAGSGAQVTATPDSAPDLPGIRELHSALLPDEPPPPRLPT